NSQIGEHTNDPWVNYNRLAQDNTHRLFPKNSTGRFFPTLSESKGTSRLSLSDWLRNIFNRYQDAKIAWIDPFMEDAGIEILHRMGTSKGDYLIITTEKQQKEEDCIKANQPNRISKLLLSCEEWGKGYFGNVKLKVLTVPEGKLHDRMILIRAENDEPLAGYHLSNSIQRANENFPLLATPIPLDVLPDVFKFTDEIIQSTLYGDVKGPTPTASLIFDSTKYKILVKENLERLNKQQFFLDVPRSGDVLAWWLNDQEFEGIYGSTLSDLMQKKGYLKDDQLNSEQFDSLPHKFFIEGFPLADFHSAWDAAGYILANSRAGDSFRMGESSSLPDKLKKLLFNHLDPFRVNALPTKLKSSHIDIEFYRNKSLTELLFSNNVPERVFQDSLIETSWSDYYAIKLLWLNSPRDFIDWLSQMCFSPSTEPYRKLVLIIQTFKFISLSLRFNKDLEKID
ncbi:VPA1262 family protein, partial [Acinetobacter sp. ANC 4639]